MLKFLDKYGAKENGTIFNNNFPRNYFIKNVVGILFFRIIN